MENTECGNALHLHTYAQTYKKLGTKVPLCFKLSTNVRLNRETTLWDNFTESSQDIFKAIVIINIKPNTPTA